MKKRMIACLTALVMVISCTFTGAMAADVSEAYETPGVDGLIEDDAGIMPLADLSFSFNLSKGQYAYSSEIYRIEDGDVKLHIISATWSLGSNSVWIGYYNVDTKADYGVSYSGGNITNKTVTAKNIPDGSYKIIVKNLGPSSISGAIQYYVD